MFDSSVTKSSANEWYIPTALAVMARSSLRSFSSMQDEFWLSKIWKNRNAMGIGA